ncbi:CheR family methyltransferase [Alkalibacillus haloalkaliphilus]|uniref:CheR family methyltransferase n=1 Tax=Alkalibacillus haloalkaliphilus TaxID=94136 RepID=UPI002935F357|nr:protein-glutamate O-methyltransferase CheR [Alkalibacillus haloalkaliphilus]MDV2580827.1 protein-glutamate O-methyltransferase CheR [Alkalibacillus haloalkaliphilus]
MRDDYITFISDIKKRTGIDLALYKEKQMKRRLTTLRDKRGFANFNDYYKALIQDEQLYFEFLDRMTINVSEFYRNFNRWETFRTKILPRLKEGKDRLKVWSAACSTGEEPYTIAMILSDYFPLEEITIHATDIDELAIQRAKEGVYPERSLKEVPQDKKEKYFHKKGNFYSLSDEIKKCVQFSKHNLLADRYRSSYDLIVCRNVLIYFTEDAKNQVYDWFSQSLVEGGVLFVGSTEQIFNPQSFYFEVAETFFYEKQ